MTYYDLYRSVTEVVNTNRFSVEKGLARLAEFEAAAGDEHVEDIAKLKISIQQREEMIFRVADRVQKMIRDLALLSHATEGFPAELLNPQE